MGPSVKNETEFHMPRLENETLKLMKAVKMNKKEERERKKKMQTAHYLDLGHDLCACVCVCRKMPKVTRLQDSTLK